MELRVLFKAHSCGWQNAVPATVGPGSLFPCWLSASSNLSISRPPLGPCHVTSCTDTPTQQSLASSTYAEDYLCFQRAPLIRSGPPKIIALWNNLEYTYQGTYLHLHFPLCQITHKDNRQHNQGSEIPIQSHVSSMLKESSLPTSLTTVLTVL